MDRFMKAWLLVALSCLPAFGIDYFVEGLMFKQEPGLIAFSIIVIAFIALICLLSGLAWTLLKE